MKALFSYKEFINMMEKNHLPVIKQNIPEKGSSISVHDGYLTLIISGIVAGYCQNQPENIMNLVGEGCFLGMAQLVEDDTIPLNYQTLSACTLYRYRIEDIQYVLTFPENYGFQYFMTKKLANSFFYKAESISYLQSNVKHRLAYVVKGIIKSIIKEEEKDVYILPSCITTTVLRNYSTISSSAFYSNLAALREIGAITKINHCWHVNMEKLNFLLGE
ncbi:Crp/Fnr family transcriptional regulator [Listeria costaricensis]|uniref:Crp/Fnr family transcriptional regulator n=1 Tax=Listeria costaricensis TaxID=2026604 RepID=UPI000C074763|nr:Crp/Fnr family transcriptional regulator [Listeria costaricensis]